MIKKIVIMLNIIFTFICFSENKSCTELQKYSKNAQIIDLKSKKLKEINCISNYEDVRELDLRWNEISDLKPLENLKKLEILKINFNQIEDITPLFNLENLRELWVHNNKIKSVNGISKLKKLEHLDISFNPVYFAINEISELKNLKRLEVRNIPEMMIAAIYGNQEKFKNLKYIAINDYEKLRFLDGHETEVIRFADHKIIDEIKLKDIKLKKIPKDVYKIFTKNDDDESPVLTTAKYYKNNNYEIYIGYYYREEFGISYNNAIFLNSGKFVGELLAYDGYLLESPEGDNLYAMVRDAHGSAHYDVMNAKTGEIVDDERDVIY